MAHEGARAIERRTVSWDPELGVLTVGERSVTLTCPPGDNECILETYLHLVAEQRAVRLDRKIVLRRDDVLVLAELLDLDDVRLEQKLASFLRLSDPEAKALRRDLLRQRVSAAALGVGLVAGLPLAAAVGTSSAGASDATSSNRTEAPANEHGDLDLTDTPTTAAVTVEVPTPAPDPAPPAPVVAADPTDATEPEPEPEPSDAPPPSDDVEIGYTVTYERDPDYVPPDGVEIGDAMVIERDLPPSDEG